MCWGRGVGYRVNVERVLLQCVVAVLLGTGLLLCVCVTIMFWCSTVGYKFSVVCVLV